MVCFGEQQQALLITLSSSSPYQFNYPAFRVTQTRLNVIMWHRSKAGSMPLIEK